MLVFAWIIFSVVAGFVGSGRKCGFFGAFILSLLLSPLIGFIIAFASERVSDVELKESLKEHSKDDNIIDKSITEQIKEAKDLLDNGVITQEEFDKIKCNLLDK